MTASCEVWMMTKLVVSVAAIIGYNRCHMPRHRIKEALDEPLSYLEAWTKRFRLAIDRGTSRPWKQFKLMDKKELLNIACHVWSLIILLENGKWQALNVWEDHELQHVRHLAPAVQCTGNAY
ncbi:hypothetical protein TNCV_4734881 [Trichonephila clavipes]|nr:hypothetical protein TNCV_4734881 [Trichonephila clavipes]